MRAARGNSSARRCANVECSESASAGLTGPSGNRANTRRSPTVEKTRSLWPIAPSVPSTWMASSTLSRLCAGSPIPMNTTFLTVRRERARTTCATISALPSWRCNPSRPVMQNAQPTAQPICVDTHTPWGGSRTLSTVLPSDSATSSRAEPSWPRCSSLTRASRSSSAATSGSVRRSDSGRKCSAARAPLVSGNAWVHARRTASS